MRLMDMPYSPGSPDVKPDQLPIFLSPRTVKGKLASESSSVMHYSFSPARLANGLSTKLPT
uniref:Uncharacterized protein n=1 Tax=Rhizophora mucronata TaxID=61149 RepID=A0A2P2J4X2_RHIMU